MGVKWSLRVNVMHFYFLCKAARFEKDMRILDVQGYDLILGLYWLTGLRPMTVDWGKGCRAFQQGEREVKLQVQEEVAEIRMYQGTKCQLGERKEERRVAMKMLTIFWMSSLLGLAYTCYMLYRLIRVKRRREA